MSERIKAALSAKLDSREKFEAVLHEIGDSHCIGSAAYDCRSLTDICFPRVRDGLCLEFDTRVPKTHWWWLREAMRLKFGVYPSMEDSQVIQYLLGQTFLLPYVPHVSTEDPTRIAVTMSPEDGCRDKQTVMALGRWIKRMFPSATDHFIQGLEAMHRADMSDELEIVYDAAEIEEVYTNMRGDTGCMRHHKDYWDLPYHPSVVYSSPGFGVAVVRNADGRVTGRSVVYEDPENPSDKRYVRIYGDLSLKRRLERNGYRMAGLADTVMDAHAKGSEENYFIMPYIDPPGGASSGVSDKRVYGAYRQGDNIYLAGEAKFNAVHRALAARNMRADGYLVGVTGTSGYIYLRELPHDLFQWTCIVTGQTYEVTEAAPVKAKFNGQVGSAHESAVEGWVELRTAVDGQAVTAYCPPDTPTFSWNYTLWEDTEESRVHCGYVRLANDLYPDDQEWYLRYELVKLQDGRMVKRHDVAVLNELDGIRCVLKTEVQADWVRLHRSSSFPGMPVYSTPDAKWNVTRSGTKVGRYTHDVVVLHDGTLEFARNCVTHHLPIGGVGCTVRKDTTAEQLLDLAVANATKAIDHAFDYAVQEGLVDLTDAAMQRSLLHSWMGMSVVPVVEDDETPQLRYLRDLTSPFADALIHMERYVALPEEPRRRLCHYNYHPENRAQAILGLLRHINQRMAEITPPQPEVVVEEVSANTERYVVAS